MLAAATIKPEADTLWKADKVRQSTVMPACSLVMTGEDKDCLNDTNQRAMTWPILLPSPSRPSFHTPARGSAS